MRSRRFALRSGVNFEVPRQYAANCGGRPVRVGPLAAQVQDLLVTWNADVLSFAHGVSRVEYDLFAVRGLLVDPRRSIVADVQWCSLDVVFVVDGGTVGLPVFTAHLANESSFHELVSDVAACSLPVQMGSRVQDLPTRDGE